MANGRVLSENNIDRITDEKLKNAPPYVSEWNKVMKASRKTAATRRDYIVKVCNFLRYISNKENIRNLDVSVITKENVIDYMISIQTKKTENGTTYTSDSYQYTVWCCLNCFFEYLLKNNMIKENYILDVDRHGIHDLDRINEHRMRLTVDDIHKILATIRTEKDAFYSKRDYAMVMLLINTGMRETALAYLQTSDFDFENKKLTVIDKGYKRHVYTLNESTIDSINDWLKKRKYYAPENLTGMFISKEGEQITNFTVMNVTKKYSIKSLGYRVSPHKFRSAFCSMLYDKTHDIEFCRRAVGHSSSETTQRYIVTKDDPTKKASEILENLI